MNLREGLKAIADAPPSEIVPTKFGDVKVVAPMAARVDFFKTALGDKADEYRDGLGLLVAVACHDPATGAPMFTPADVPWLDTVPLASFGLLVDAVRKISESLSLDPTTPATAPGSA